MHRRINNHLNHGLSIDEKARIVSEFLESEGYNNHRTEKTSDDQDENSDPDNNDVKLVKWSWKGCALGAGIGLAVGAGIGGYCAGPQGALIGGIVGMISGALIGGSIYDEIEELDMGVDIKRRKVFLKLKIHKKDFKFSFNF